MEFKKFNTSIGTSESIFLFDLINSLIWELEILILGASTSLILLFDKISSGILWSVSLG